jgi:hypothetical protein
MKVKNFHFVSLKSEKKCFINLIKEVKMDIQIIMKYQAG